MKNKEKIVKIVTLAIICAIVIILQFAGSFIKFGTFSVSLVLVPITIGAILLGPLAGTILGFVFGLVVIWSGDAAGFMAISNFGTIVVVLGKGTLAGLAAGWMYKGFKRFNHTLGCIMASIITPIVNTGVFALGTMTIFHNSLESWSSGSGKNAITYLFLTMIGVNFFFELGVNAVLSPAIGRISLYGFDQLQFNNRNKDLSDEDFEDKEE